MALMCHTFLCVSSDYCMVVTIVDPSIQQSLKCVFFQPDVKQLPQVKSVGDIVRFHRLKVRHAKLKPHTLDICRHISATDSEVKFVCVRIPRFRT